MAANANIVVADSQPTPVNHTFSPVRIKGDVASYVNFDALTSAARETLSAQMRDNAKLRTVTVVLKKPKTVTETINGVSVTTVQDFGTAKVEMIVPMGWSVTEAEDLVEMTSNALKNSLIIAMASRGEFVY